MSVQVVKPGKHNCRLPVFLKVQRFGKYSVIKCKKCGDTWQLDIGKASLTWRWFREEDVA